jgi:sec-independent protein translocase protein TatC
MAKSHDEDDLFKHTSMTFGEHLEELRSSLFKAVISLAIGFGIGLYFAPDIVKLVQSPLESALKTYYKQEAIEYINARLPKDLRNDPAIEEMVLKEELMPEEVFVSPDMFTRLPPAAGPGAEKPAAKAGIKPGMTRDDLVRSFVWRPLSDDDRVKLKAFNVQEGFMIWIKAALLFGALVSSPFVFYFLWNFVAAGLYPHEKKYVHTFLPASVGLFVCGATLAFTLVFPPVLQFFFSINKSMGQALEPRISEWMSFVLLLPLGFGVSFQLPLVMLFLERIHIFSVQVYLSKWRIAVLVMAVAAMVLSPGGDPNSMMFMLVPLIGLYFAGIGLCKWLPSKRAPTTSNEKAKEYAGVD